MDCSKEGRPSAATFRKASCKVYHNLLLLLNTAFHAVFSH